MNCVVIVLGVQNVGKTSMLMAYHTDVFPQEYNPHLYTSDDYPIEKVIDGQGVLLHAWDAPVEGHAGLRRFYYTCADVFLLCFELTQPQSYENIYTDIWPEINRRRPNIPVIIVGTKVDLLDDEVTLTRLREEGVAPLSSEDGLRLCKEINAVKYMECSSLTRDGLDEIFEEAVRMSLKNKSVEKGCFLL